MFLGRFLLETGPRTPLLMGTHCPAILRTKFHPEGSSYPGTLPFDAIGFRGMGTQFFEAQAMGYRREGLVLEEDPVLQATCPQLFVVLAQVLDCVFMAAQAQLLVSFLLHLG